MGIQDTMGVILSRGDWLAKNNNLEEKMDDSDDRKFFENFLQFLLQENLFSENYVKILGIFKHGIRRMPLKILIPFEDSTMEVFLNIFWSKNRKMEEKVAALEVKNFFI
jgi:hypothetical protein